MKIVTWNVNSVRTRLPHVLAFLQAEKPDVLMLQETKVENHLFPLDAFVELGYSAVYHGQKSYNGVAILARSPLADVVTGFDGVDMEGQARVLAATVGGIRCVCAYVVNGQEVGTPAFEVKKNFYANLSEYVLAQSCFSDKVVVAGDFNIAADERDVDRPDVREGRVLFTPEERAWLADFMAKAHVKDAFRLLSDERGVFSWWDYRDFAFQKKRGMRIDYLFVSPALEPLCEQVVHYAEERGRVQPSDHVPVGLRIRGLKG